MSAEVRIWDIGVRLFHWSLVILFALAYVSADDDASGLHAWLGYAIIALLGFRLVWGLVGSKHARFTDFIYAPRRILAYVKDMAGGHPRRYLGHNPAGGLMIVVMLVMLTIISWTGLKADEARHATVIVPSAINFVVPSAHADEDEESGEGREGGEFWEEAHEASINIMLALIALHLAGVTAASLAHRENLARAMVTGRKREPEA